MRLRWRVRTRKRRTLRSGDPRIQEALLRQAGLYCSGQNTSLATPGTAMMIRKRNCNTQPGRRKEQRSSDSTKENGNRNEETHTDHLKVHLTSETGKKMERN